MASIKRSDYRVIDQAFGMGSGYVLDFSNRTLSEWFEDEFNIDIYADRYAGRGDSKANRIRAFVDVEPAPLVSRLLRALWKYRERMANYSAENEARDREQLFELIVKLDDHGSTIPRRMQNGLTLRISPNRSGGWKVPSCKTQPLL